MRIKRFTIRVADEPQTVLIPAHAKILTARMEGAHLCLYASVGPAQPEVARKIRVLATDVEFEGLPGLWLATLTHKSQTYHVFELLMDLSRSS